MNLEKCADQAYQSIMESVQINLAGSNPTDTTECSEAYSMLHKIDSEAAALEYILGTIQFKIRKRLSDIRQRRNFIISPIYHLPIEITQDIFLKTIHSDAHNLVIHQIRSALMGVSSLWLTTILSNPNMWSHFEINEGPKRIPRLLQMSANTSLTIPGYQVSLNKLVPHLHRIRSFESNCEDKGHYESLREFLQNPAPVLERLAVRGSRSGSIAIPGLLFAGQAPRLRYLSIKSFRFDWDSLTSPKLETLSITDWGDEAEDGTLRYHRLLSSLPSLERLMVVQSDRGGGGRAHPRNHHLNAVSLPKLSQVSFENFSCATFASVISIMSTNSLQNLGVTINKIPTAEAIEPIYQLPSFPTFHSLISSLTWISISCGTDQSAEILLYETESHFRKSIPGRSLRLHLHNESNISLLQLSIPFFRSLLQAASIRSIHTDGRIFEKGDQGLTRTVAQLSGLRELVIMGSKGTSDAIESLLGPVLDTDSILPALRPYPSLEKLQFSHAELDLPALLNVLKQRFGDGAGSGNGGLVPLKELRFTSYQHQGTFDRDSLLELVDLMKRHGGKLSYGY